MVKASSLLGLQDLWAETQGDPRIRIAVLDGPVERSHSCFGMAQLQVLPTLVPSGQVVGAMTAHGTHVASLIFGGHGSDVQGLAPRCRGLLGAIFSDQRPQVSQLDLARAMTQAVEAGAHVINISGGQLTEAGEASDLLAKAVRLCHERNVLIVAAAGNDGCDCLHVPAALDAVLAVGAMDIHGQPLTSSNWGEQYQFQGILAPGAEIEGAKPAGGCASMTGTSFATPIVSGVAALLLSWQIAQGQQPDPHQVRSLLLDTALPCEADGLDSDRRCLKGKLNIPGILTILKGGRMSEVQDVVTSAGCGCQTTQNSVSQPPELEQAQPEQAIANAEPSVVVPGAAATPVTHDAIATPLAQPAIPNSSTPYSSNSAMSEQLSPAAVTASESPSDLIGADLVFALGTLGYDFGTEARRDSFKQLMQQWPTEGVNIPPNPYDARQMVAYIGQHLSEASSLIWTLNLELTPIYAVEPKGPFAREIYAALHALLEGEVEAEHDLDYIQRVSIPGRLTGKTVRLFSGQVVPVIEPATMRGIYGWQVNAVVEDAINVVAEDRISRLVNDRVMESGEGDISDEERQAIRIDIQGKMQGALESLLNRIYYDLRNLGQTSQDRALNFAATNAFQTATVLAQAVGGGMELDTISVEKSPYCRMDSDCWDVKLKFFDPENRRRARQVFRFTIDVSDLIPVTLGEVRNWRVSS